MARGERADDQYLGHKLVFEEGEPVNIFDRLVGERQERARERIDNANRHKDERSKRRQRLDSQLTGDPKPAPAKRGRGRRR